MKGGTISIQQKLGRQQLKSVPGVQILGTKERDMSREKSEADLALHYNKIPKISPGAYSFSKAHLRSLFLEGLIYGGKFAFENRLG